MEAEWDSFDVYYDMPYEEYLETDAWRAKRAFLIRAAGYRCQLCNATGRFELHHRTYERLGHEEPSDLLVLCGACHSRFHDGRGAAALAGHRSALPWWEYPRRMLVVAIAVTVPSAVAFIGFAALWLFVGLLPDLVHDFNVLTLFVAAISLAVVGWSVWGLKTALLGRASDTAWYGLPKTPDGWRKWHENAHKRQTSEDEWPERTWDRG